MNDELTREIFGNVGGANRIVFYALCCASLACFGWGVWRRARLWKLGKPSNEKIDWSATYRRILSPVLSQRTVRQGRQTAGRAHAVLFWGFGILLVGTTLVAVEHYGAALLGRSATQPLFHKGLYFAVFEVVLDAGGLMLLSGCCWFLIRRLRGNSSMAYGTGDAWVLVGLMAIVVSGYSVESARIVLQETPLPGFSFVGWTGAHILQATGVDPTNAPEVHLLLWWLHALGALTLIAAFPYGRLLHTIAGTLNLTVTPDPLGTLRPVSLEELEETGQVGVGRIPDWTRRQLLSLDACVSCGRCEDACPAFAAGKPLSPRDLVQDVRTCVDREGPTLLAKDRSRNSWHSFGPLTLPSPQRGEGTSDSYCSNDPSISTPTSRLHGETIGEATLWSCTTCHACLDVCPLGVRPMEMITDMRRYLIGEGQLRGTPATSLQRMQRSGNPWGLPAQERFDWAEGLEVPTVLENPDFEILYWVGCAASYDRRTQKIARAVTTLLRSAGVSFACLGNEERCTGESARRMGDEFLFQELAATNIETFTKYRVRKIVTHCPHCLNSLIHDYPQFGGHYEVVHHSQLLAELIEQGRLRIDAKTARQVTYHDPCYLARVHDVVDPPRQVLERATGDNEICEMARHGRDTACCGGGGGRMWLDDSPADRIGKDRIEEAISTGVDTICVACPFCLTMMTDGLAAEGSPAEVRDVAELLVDARTSG